MRTLVSYLPALACAALMFVCMGHMFSRSHEGQESIADEATKREISELREEIARLRAERALAPDTESVDG